MRLKFKDLKDFIVVYKPRGMRTHAVAEGQFGFVEHVKELLPFENSREIFVVHRLDKETSGLMLLARTSEAAQMLTSLFEKHLIQKEYIFLTDKKPSRERWTYESFIEKKQNLFTSSQIDKPNSLTEFELIKSLDSYYLIKAKPSTGKPHQIRLHALDSGVPILGDTEHGGSSFFRLALHAKSLSFNWKDQNLTFESEEPSFFNDGISSSEPLEILKECLFEKIQLFEFSNTECFRIVHDQSKDFKADHLGEVIWIYDYSSPTTSLFSQDELKKLEHLLNKKCALRQMINRGQGVGGLEEKTLISEDLKSWIATENHAQFLFKGHSGFSPGLFLDQRHNREWVKLHSKNLNILNLFSYTSAFSVMAAIGQAAKVTTVDVSKNFIDWSKENFKLNSLPVEKHEFFVQDVSLFVKGSLKRERKWDLIICDPPTFGRSSEGTWKIERDLPDLVANLFQLLNQNGIILLTSNYEKTNRQDLIQLATKKIKSKNYKINRLPLNPMDIQITDDITNDMKGFFLQKLS